MTTAMGWSRKELSNVGIIIREKQTSLKMGFLCFAFQNHELCILFRRSFGCIPSFSDAELDE
jgi:hypothetical protein